MTVDDVALSVVLPAYQEEENLRLLLPRLCAVLANLGVRSEVLVIDTSRPRDHTREACEEHPGVRHIPRRGSDTFGAAYSTGISESKGRHVIFMDADGSHTPEFIPELYQYANDYHVVVASRYVEHGDTENPQHLIVMSRVLNWTYTKILDIDCKDVSNSFKVYQGPLLRSLELHCDNFDIIEEILVKLKRKQPDLRIKEIPFLFKKRMFGQTKRNLVLFTTTYLATLARLRYGK